MSDDLWNDLERIAKQPDPDELMTPTQKALSETREKGEQVLKGITDDEKQWAKKVKHDIAWNLDSDNPQAFLKRETGANTPDKWCSNCGRGTYQPSNNAPGLEECYNCGVDREIENYEEPEEEPQRDISKMKHFVPTGKHNLTTGFSYSHDENCEKCVATRARDKARQSSINPETGVSTHCLQCGTLVPTLTSGLCDLCKAPVVASRQFCASCIEYGHTASMHEASGDCKCGHPKDGHGMGGCHSCECPSTWRIASVEANKYGASDEGWDVMHRTPNADGKLVTRSQLRIKPTHLYESSPGVSAVTHESVARDAIGHITSPRTDADAAMLKELGSTSVEPGHELIVYAPNRQGDVTFSVGENGQLIKQDDDD